RDRRRPGGRVDRPRPGLGWGRVDQPRPLPLWVRRELRSRKRIRTKLLADTSALLALFPRRDQNHAAAVAFLRASPHASFVVTHLIVSEAAMRVRARVDAAAAVAVARDLTHSRRYVVLFLDPELLEASFERMSRFAGKRLSLADCASFAVIDRPGLGAAFSF